MGYWNLVEPYWDRISIYDGPIVFLAQFAEAPEASGHLFASHFAQSEISNGGMHQLFWNSTGVLVPEAVSGFQALGLDIFADRLRHATSLFGGIYPRECAQRREILETMASDIFDECDQVFFAHLSAHPSPNAFERAADAYAERHVT
jgi:hypothetical protein